MWILRFAMARPVSFAGSILAKRRGQFNSKIGSARGFGEAKRAGERKDFLRDVTGGRIFQKGEGEVVNANVGDRSHRAIRHRGRRVVREIRRPQKGEAERSVGLDVARERIVRHKRERASVFAFQPDGAADRILFAVKRAFVFRRSPSRSGARRGTAALRKVSRFRAAEST